MKYRTVIFVVLAMLTPANLMATDLNDQVFPYGLLELRGYPMKMSKDGTFRIYSGSTTFAEGSFSIEGDKMTISDHGGTYACRGKRMNPGSYYWAVHNQELQLKLIKDLCGARSTAFLEAPLKIRQVIQ